MAWRVGKGMFSVIGVFFIEYGRNVHARVVALSSPQGLRQRSFSILRLEYPIGRRHNTVRRTERFFFPL